MPASVELRQPQVHGEANGQERELQGQQQPKRATHREVQQKRLQQHVRNPQLAGEAESTHQQTFCRQCCSHQPRQKRLRRPCGAQGLAAALLSMRRSTQAVGMRLKSASKAATCSLRRLAVASRKLHSRRSCSSSSSNRCCPNSRQHGCEGVECSAPCQAQGMEGRGSRGREEGLDFALGSEQELTSSEMPGAPSATRVAPTGIAWESLQVEESTASYSEVFNKLRERKRNGDKQQLELLRKQVQQQEALLDQLLEACTSAGTSKDDWLGSESKSYEEEIDGGKAGAVDEQEQGEISGLGKLKVMECSSGGTPSSRGSSTPKIVAMDSRECSEQHEAEDKPSGGGIPRTHAREHFGLGLREHCGLGERVSRASHDKPNTRIMRTSSGVSPRASLGFDLAGLGRQHNFSSKSCSDRVNHSSGPGLSNAEMAKVTRSRAKSMRPALEDVACLASGARGLHRTLSPMKKLGSLIATQDAKSASFRGKKARDCRDPALTQRLETISYCSKMAKSRQQLKTQSKAGE